VAENIWPRQIMNDFFLKSFGIEVILSDKSSIIRIRAFRVIAYKMQLCRT